MNLADRLDWRGAATLLGVSPFTIRSWVREQRVPHYRIGRLIYFSKRRLLAWQDRRTVVVQPVRRVG
jgi:excisionase family DNA binding protein